MAGTVNVSRDLWDDPTFKDSEMSQREAWVWMIADAAWKPHTRRFGPHEIDLQRGQLAASTRYMAKAWMWSEARVRRYLDVLENRRMIHRQTDAGVTVVTICKYDTYQNGPKSSDAAATQQSAQQRRTVDAKDKKGEIREEGKKEDANASSHSPTPSASRFQEFWDFYPHRNGNKKGRADCERVYAKAVKAGVPELQIIEAAIRAQSDPDVRRGYGRAALPWLNQQGWSDEIQPAQPTLTLIPGGTRDQFARDDRSAAARTDALRHQINVAAGMQRTPREDCF